MGRIARNIEKNHHKQKYQDEYYTTYFEVETIFSKVLDINELKDKTIYCPADGERSNFVKYLKDHKDEIGYKELIYSNDDFRTHENDFKKADYVITNPPFSLSEILLQYCKDYDCKFFLFGPIAKLIKYVKIFSSSECFYDRRLEYLLRGHNWFETPFISKQFGDHRCYVDFCIYYSNIKIQDAVIEKLRPKKFKSKSLSEINPVFYRNGDEKILLIDKMEKVPYDYDGLMAWPMTCLYSKYANDLEVLGKAIIEPEFCDDKKSRYVRFLCRLKH